MRSCSLSMLLLATSWAALHAQQPDDPAPPTPYVLHVYQNLIQVPTLVLTSSREAHKPLPITKFNISIDAGPRFHPTHMHIAGDDPITLAILLDATGDQNKFLKQLPQAFAAITRSGLQSHDHVSIYAYDCVLIRSALDLPADSATLATAINSALLAPTLHGPVPRRTCKDLSLWDAVFNVSSAIANLPGRRVLLVFSDGHSTRGNFAFSNAARFAIEHAVAIFGMRDRDRYDEDHFAGSVDHLSLSAASPTATFSENLFDELCQKTGGLLSTVSSRELTVSMQKFVAMLRGRYILEFPRPDIDIPGNHLIDVTTADVNDYVRTSGVSVPAPTPHDPNALPPQPSPATFGKRRPLASSN